MYLVFPAAAVGRTGFGGAANMKSLGLSPWIPEIRTLLHVLFSLILKATMMSDVRVLESLIINIIDSQQLCGSDQTL